MTSRTKITKALLVCGVLSSLSYAIADVLASLRWEGYRLVDRSMSELMAVGSPTRDFIVPFMTAYNLLVIAFGAGVWMAGRGRRSVRATGALLVVYGVVSWMGLSWSFRCAPTAGSPRARCRSRACYTARPPRR